MVVATAVLTGAMMVGDSVRQSLRDLAVRTRAVDTDDVHDPRFPVDAGVDVARAALGARELQAARGDEQNDESPRNDAHDAPLAVLHDSPLLPPERPHAGFRRNEISTARRVRFSAYPAQRPEVASP